jgi:protein associated with RNAse G/E
MHSYLPYIIKSFKYNGHLHRTWLQNWLVPPPMVLPQHQQEAMHILINHRTPIIEADGKKWTSRVPGVSFFIPDMWYNVVALLEDNGIRYYCNIASPPYLTGNVMTYIDYDLDVIVLPNRKVSVVDQEEYMRHKASYQYPEFVQRKVEESVQLLLARIERVEIPFCDDDVYYYFEQWKKGV